MTHNESLVNVVSAIGALKLAKFVKPSKRQHLCDALDYYNSGVTALRSEIEGSQPGRQELLNLSWSTFLFGLFELMYDNTGTGWVWHLLRGTARLLQLLTPDGCRYGTGREIFLEVRVFEIARAMLFSDRTFLSTGPWLNLMNDIWTGDYTRDWSPKENLLDLMVLVSDLCIRATEFVRSKEDVELPEVDVRALKSYANEGFQLKSALIAWMTVAQKWQPLSSDDHQMMLAWIFYSATSIYHSGIYDYSPLWSRHHVSTPSLDQHEIQQHVNTILETASQALHRTNLTSLIFLFPLRIAGARAIDVQQRARIQALLKQITPNFEIANAFLSDLGELWADPMAKCNTPTAR